MDFSSFTIAQIVLARSYASCIHFEVAEEALEDNHPYASHVTLEDRCKIAQDRIKYGKEVINGKHDHVFATRQRMYYYLTGECVAFLP